jgi:hypothetical protein
MVRQPLLPRKPYRRVLISQTTSESSFGSKVHPTARSSTNGHRVSAKTIRSGGVPAQVHNGRIRSCRQGQRFPQRAAATTVENPFLTSLLRSYYKSKLNRIGIQGIAMRRFSSASHGRRCVHAFIPVRERDPSTQSATALGLSLAKRRSTPAALPCRMGRSGGFRPVGRQSGS